MSINSSSLNIFLSSFLHLLEIIEITNVLSKIYDILSFFYFFILITNDAI